MSQLVLTKECVALLQKQHQVFEYAEYLLKSSDHYALFADQEIKDYNLIDLMDKTKFLTVILYFLEDVEVVSEIPAAAIYTQYFLLHNDKETYHLYQYLAAKQCAGNLPVKLSDSLYFCFVEAMHALCRHLETLDSTPRFDFKTNVQYRPNNFEIKLALNLMGEKALDYMAINRKSKCCAM